MKKIDTKIRKSRTQAEARQFVIVKRELRRLYKLGYTMHDIGPEDLAMNRIDLRYLRDYAKTLGQYEILLTS